MTTTAAIGDHLGLLDKERIIAPADYNRWLVPPAALAIHLCIGMAYGFSVFWLPLGRAIGIAEGLDKAVPCPGDATTFWARSPSPDTLCSPPIATGPSSISGWMFTLFFVLLGTSAAIWGGWLERVGYAEPAWSPPSAGAVAF